MFNLVMQGLWKGTVPGILLTVPYTSVQFVTVDLCRKAAKFTGMLEALNHSGACSVKLSMLLWVMCNCVKRDYYILVL